MNKYKNKKIVVDGVTFDSKKEAEYWRVLKTRQDFGEIENLRRQEKYLLIPKQSGERSEEHTSELQSH